MFMQFGRVEKFPAELAAGQRLVRFFKKPNARKNLIFRALAFDFF
jgi:hypothetical protein